MIWLEQWDYEEAAGIMAYFKVTQLRFLLRVYGRLMTPLHGVSLALTCPLKEVPPAQSFL